MKKLWNMKVKVIPIKIGAIGSHLKIDTGTGKLGNKRSECHLNYSIMP